jgi:hypothetical protein
MAETLPADRPGGRPGGRPADLDALLDRVPSLTGSPRHVPPLTGGLTNHNYKVSTPDGTFVARRCPPGRAGLPPAACGAAVRQ